MGRTDNIITMGTFYVRIALERFYSIMLILRLDVMAVDFVPLDIQ